MASRSVRSRADKNRDKDKGATNQGKETVSSASLNNDIVPGKFTEGDWYSLLHEEEEQDYGQDIVEDLISETLNQCYAKYIQKQLLPYTVEQARKALLEVVELRFLEKDVGEAWDAYDITWVEDEEPEASYIDSWAAGAVPYAAQPTDEESITQVLESHKQDPSANQIIEDNTGVLHESQLEEEQPQLEEDVANEEQPGADPQEMQLEEQVPKPPSGKKKTKRRSFVPHRGPMPSAGLSRMSETIAETEARLAAAEIEIRRLEAEDNHEGSTDMPAKLQHALKAQLTRPGDNNAPLTDIAIVTAPHRRQSAADPPASSIGGQVKTGFSVVDPEVEEAQARLIAMRTGRYNPDSSLPTGAQQTTIKKSKNTGQTNGNNGQEFRSEQQLGYDRAASTNVAPVPPPLIESMDVAAGVIVREGGRVKQGPKRLQRQSGSAKHMTEAVLVPVSKNRAKPPIAVHDIIQPLGNASKMPLPPIST